MRLIVAFCAAGVVGCANIGSPPGAPERATPPVLVEVTPDSGAVNVRANAVVFAFDEVVSDRGGAGGMGGVESFFLVSPNEGAPRVRWRRDRIEVRPRRNFRPNTAYSVTMLPGITDLRGNVMTEGKAVIFSTGPTIPAFAVLGRVFDWPNARVAPNAYVEVMRLPDSLRYLGTADSTGQFAVGPLEEGAYVVRAILDNNRNRGVDPGEPWDSVAITVRGTSPFLELLAAQRDTVAPRLQIVSAPDTLSIVASFDRPLDPAVPLTPASFRVVDSDSNRLRIARVQTRAQADAERATRDSIARRDSLAADTTRRADTARARPPVARPLPTTEPPAAAAAQAKPSRPSPVREVVLRLDSLTPLKRGASYRVVAIDARGLLGATRTSDRVLTVPAARRDTSTAPPARPAPARRP